VVSKNTLLDTQRKTLRDLWVSYHINILDLGRRNAEARSFMTTGDGLVASVSTR
jgi:hypothetical protein